MKELKQRLVQELNQNPNIKIVKSEEWFLPVKSIEITFQTVKRSKMDILMKMMLITFQKASIESIEELSDMLLVEPLFIKDLVDKMLRTEMVGKVAGVFELKKTGLMQLEAGIFISEEETEVKSVLYSPSHEGFLKGQMKNKSNEKLKEFRYARTNRKERFAESELLEILQSMGVENEVGQTQITVERITSAIEIEHEEVPCLEFRLHHTVENFVYVRVWNCLLMEWDKTIETELNEKERKKWHKELKL